MTHIFLRALGNDTWFHRHVQACATAHTHACARTCTWLFFLIPLLVVRDVRASSWACGEECECKRVCAKLKEKVHQNWSRFSRSFSNFLKVTLRSSVFREVFFLSFFFFFALNSSPLFFYDSNFNFSFTPNFLHLTIRKWTRLIISPKKENRMTLIWRVNVRSRSPEADIDSGQITLWSCSICYKNGQSRWLKYSRKKNTVKIC